MLPGLRFLFAAIVLATSLLVFGLGAAALLRAAHEEFASIPARQAPPEPQFAQQPEAPPVLAMMRVDPAPADDPAPPTVAASEPATPATMPPSAEPNKMAAVTQDDSSSATVPKPDVPAMQAPAPVKTTEAAQQTPIADPLPAPQSMPPPSEVTSAPAEPMLAAVADAPTAANQPAPAAPPPVMTTAEPGPPPTPEAILAATKIATLGGPAVVVETPAAPKPAEVKKPQRIVSARPAHRKERRRIARPRPVRQVVVQQPLDPFGQPLLPLTRR